MYNAGHKCVLCLLLKQILFSLWGLWPAAIHTTSFWEKERCVEFGTKGECEETGEMRMFSPWGCAAIPFHLHLSLWLVQSQAQEFTSKRRSIFSFSLEHVIKELHHLWENYHVFLHHISYQPHLMPAMKVTGELAVCRWWLNIQTEKQSTAPCVTDSVMAWAWLYYITFYRKWKWTENSWLFPDLDHSCYKWKNPGLPEQTYFIYII